jgi:hypothetical protein
LPYTSVEGERYVIARSSPCLILSEFTLVPAQRS